MPTLQPAFAQSQNETLKKAILIRPMTGSDVKGEVVGLHTLAGSELIGFINTCNILIGSSLVAVEPRSNTHPDGKVLGYALIMKNSKLGPSGICIQSLYVDKMDADRDSHLEQLIIKAARVALAQGKTSIDLCNNEDPSISSLLAKYGATESAKQCEIGVFTFHTISDLSDKFGYGAEKKAREALALKP